MSEQQTPEDDHARLNRLLASPNKEDVTRFLHILHLLLGRTANPEEWLTRNYVVKLYVVKDINTKSHHESIVAEVALMGLPERIFLRFERTRHRERLTIGEACRDQQTHSPEDEAFNIYFQTLEAFLEDGPPESLSPIHPNRSSASIATVCSVASVTSLTSSSNLFQGATAAEDRVTRLEKMVDTELVLDTFEPRNMSLLHLAELAVIVHNNDRIYSLLRHQCFWWATLVYLVAHRVHRDSPGGSLPNPTQSPISTSQPSNMITAERLSQDVFQREDEEVWVEANTQLAGSTSDPQPQEKEFGKRFKREPPNPANRSCTWKGVKIIKVEASMIQAVLKEYVRTQGQIQATVHDILQKQQRSEKLLEEVHQTAEKRIEEAKELAAQERRMREEEHRMREEERRMREEERRMREEEMGAEIERLTRLVAELQGARSSPS
ncbi:hypothetical protein NLJ89_g11423 [Agrocybe chaxingu]|uniref:Uncharacterized protein n=1 Tax=Agrocybe chaxingu TaxID=84603 RepID=A0A9W8JWT7_9AGAR|nr:hypothetical protein NLJ89_g11423 [Agrocybe chaxingu]